MLSGCLAPDVVQTDAEKLDELRRNRITPLKEVAVWEEYNLDIIRDHILPDKFKYTCKHVKNNIVPYVIVGYNEGGCDSVGICLECAAEILQKIQNNEIELN